MPCLRCNHCVGRRFSDLPPSHVALPFYWYGVEGSTYSIALIRQWFEYGLCVDASLPEVFLCVPSGEIVGIYDHVALRSFWYGAFNVILGSDPPLSSSAPSLVASPESAESPPLSSAEQQLDYPDSPDGSYRRSRFRRRSPTPADNEFRLGPRPPSLPRRSRSPRPPDWPRVRRTVRERGG